MAQQPPEAQKDRRPLRLATKEFVPRPSKPMCNSSSHFLDAADGLLRDHDPHYHFRNDFPRLDDYSDWRRVQAKFPTLAASNSPAFDLCDFEDFAFVLLLIPNLEDAHKALKYGVFSDAPDANARLDDLHRRADRKVIAFVALASERVLVGAARLNSGFIADDQFSLWTGLPKTNGFFKLQWIFLKHLDLKFSHQQHLGRPLRELPTGTELGAATGLVLLGLLDHLRFKPEKSILSLFPALDQREDVLYEPKQTRDFEIKLQKRTKPRPKTLPDLAASPKTPEDGLACDLRSFEDDRTTDSRTSLRKLNGSDTQSTSGSDIKRPIGDAKGDQKGYGTGKRGAKRNRRPRGKATDRSVTYIPRRASVEGPEASPADSPPAPDGFSTIE